MEAADEVDVDKLGKCLEDALQIEETKEYTLPDYEEPDKDDAMVAAQEEDDLINIPDFGSCRKDGQFGSMAVVRQLLLELQEQHPFGENVVMWEPHLFLYYVYNGRKFTASAARYLVAVIWYKSHFIVVSFDRETQKVRVLHGQRRRILCC